MIILRTVGSLNSRWKGAVVTLKLEVVAPHRRCFIANAVVANSLVVDREDLFHSPVVQRESTQFNGIVASGSSKDTFRRKLPIK